MSLMTVFDHDRVRWAEGGAVVSSPVISFSMVSSLADCSRSDMEGVGALIPR